MTDYTLQNDEYAKLEIAVAERFHSKVVLVGANLQVQDPNTGWYKHPGYLFNPCRAVKVLKDNFISVAYKDGAWSACHGSCVHTSPIFEIAVWRVFLEIEQPAGCKP